MKNTINKVFGSLFFFLIWVNLISQNALSEIVVNATLPSCSDGAISLTINGGIPPFDVEWFQEGVPIYSVSGIQGMNDGEDLSGVEGEESIGIEYTVIVTDALCGTAELSTRVYCACPRCELVPTDIVHPSCTDQGSVRMSWVGPSYCTFSYPFEFEWSDGSSQGFTRNDLSPGLHCLTVTNSDNCEYTGCVYMVGTENALDVYISDFQNVTQCNSTGSSQDGFVNIEINTGNAPFFYNWSNGSTAQDINNLSPGTYSVTVTDAANCEQILSVELCCCSDQSSSSGCQSGSGSSELSIEGAVVQNNFNFMSPYIETSISGGTGNYVCIWSGPNGYISSGCGGLGGPLDIGTYCLLVDDGCREVEECYDIVDCAQSDLLINAEVIDACDGYCNGSITINVSGGTPPYQYELIGCCPVGSSITACPYINYCFEITDANGCTVSDCFSIQDSEPEEVREDCLVNYFCDGDWVGEEYLGPPTDIEDEFNCYLIYSVCDDGFIVGQRFEEMIDVNEDECIKDFRCPINGEVYYYEEAMQMSEFRSGYDFEGDCYWCHDITWCEFSDGEVANINISGGIGIIEIPDDFCYEGCFSTVFCDTKDEPLYSGCGCINDFLNCIESDFRLFGPNNEELYLNIKYDTTIVEEVINGQKTKTYNIEVSSFDTLALKTYIEKINTLPNNKLIDSKENLLSYNDIYIYPNPFGDYLKIQFSNDTTLNEVSIFIIDMNGRKIYSTKCNPKESNFLELELDFLNTGVFNLQCMSSTGEIIANKRIIHYD